MSNSNDGSTIRATTDAEREEVNQFAQENPRMSELFPRTLPSGSIMEGLDLKCASCGEVVDDDWAWAKIVRTELSSKSLDTVEAKAVCPDCGVITPYFMRFHSDDMYDTVVNGQWRRGYFKKPSPPWHKRALSGLRKMLAGHQGG